LKKQTWKRRQLEAGRLGHRTGAGYRGRCAQRTDGGGAGLAVETWYLAKKDLANQPK
jgi:hypothetical protein